MDFFAKSNIGLRDKNEDSYLALNLDGRALLLAVADGVGGASAGEVASKMAIDIISANQDRILKSISTPALSVALAVEDSLREIFQEANNAIALRSSNDIRTSGMATTLTVALLVDRTLYIMHIGDSRAYLLHGSHLEKLTIDHIHNDSSMLLKYLGDNKYITPDFYCYNIMYGDLVVLCTDGIYNNLDIKGFTRLIRQHKHLDLCAEGVIEYINEHGANDNMTILLAHCMHKESNI